MARITVIGGSGYMGRRAVEALLNAGHDVTVVDRTAPPFGTVRYVEVDVTDSDSLSQVLVDTDVVMNFVGPYYRYGTTVAEAAIAAGTAYVDVCDDADVTEALLRLDDTASRAGVPVVIGAGMSPGVLNAVSQAASADFDTIDELLTAWVVDHRSPGGPAPLDHFFHGIVDQIPIWLDGRRQQVTPFSDESAEVFPFPEPIGEVEVRDIGHPETVTLPLEITARSIRNKGALMPARSAGIFRMLAGIGLLSDTEVVVGDARVRARDFTVAYLTARHNERVSPDGVDRSAMGVRVIGTRDGRPARRHVTFSDLMPMADATALPAVAAVDLVLAGDIPPGVYGPEVLGPTRWFTRLVEYTGDQLDGLRVWDDDDLDSARTMSLLECAALGHEEES